MPRARVYGAPLVYFKAYRGIGKIPGGWLAAGCWWLVAGGCWLLAPATHARRGLLLAAAAPIELIAMAPMLTY